MIIYSITYWYIIFVGLIVLENAVYLYQNRKKGKEEEQNKKNRMKDRIIQMSHVDTHSLCR